MHHSLFKDKVVIIGGGQAGTALARVLSKKLDRSQHDLVLINPRPFDVWLPGLVRAAVTSDNNIDEVNKGIFTSYDRLFAGGIGRLKIGTVVAIEPSDKMEGGHVRLHNGEVIPYDVLVLAQGSVWEGPLNLPRHKKEINEHLSSWRLDIKNANHIVLAGGGAVGVELAGELKDAYPHKAITIVHGSDMLLNGTYKRGFRKQVERGIVNRGVNVVFGDAVDFASKNASSSSILTTRAGRQLDADLIIPTRGGRPNTDVVANSGFALNAVGQIPVERTLQVRGRRDIFAVGDVTNIREQKQAAKYQSHAATVADNVLAILNGQEPISEYKGSREMIAISNGKKRGTVYIDFFGGISLGSWIARWKSRDLFITKHRKDMGWKA